MKRLLYIAIRRDSSSSAVARGSDRLGGGVLANIADGVETVVGGFHRSVRRHMPGVAELHRTSQKLRVRLQADENEQAGEIDLRYFARRQVSNADTDHNIIAKNFFDRALIARDNF